MCYVAMNPNRPTWASKRVPTPNEARRQPCQTLRGGVQVHYRGNISCVALAHSRLTAQGQISVPAKVRQRLGVGPGSVLEWDEENNRVVVRKAGRYTSEDIHRSLFARTPKRRTVDDLKRGIRRDIKKRHARR